MLVAMRSSILSSEISLNKGGIDLRWLRVSSGFSSFLLGVVVVLGRDEVEVLYL